MPRLSAETRRRNGFIQSLTTESRQCYSQGHMEGEWKLLNIRDLLITWIDIVTHARSALIR